MLALGWVAADTSLNAFDLMQASKFWATTSLKPILLSRSHRVNYNIAKFHDRGVENWSWSHILKQSSIGKTVRTVISECASQNKNCHTNCLRVEVALKSLLTVNAVLSHYTALIQHSQPSKQDQFHDINQVLTDWMTLLQEWIPFRFRIISWHLIKSCFILCISTSYLITRPFSLSHSALNLSYSWCNFCLASLSIRKSFWKISACRI